MNSPFTCINCRVSFKDSEIQRQHYKSDWHRYNLKRKVAELPFVTAEEFQKRVLAQRSKNDQLQEESNLSCKACKRNFNTRNQYENHLSSKKHKERFMKYESTMHKIKDKIEDAAIDSSESIGSANSKDISDASSSGKSNNKAVEKTDSDIESVSSDEWIEDTDNPARNNNCLFCDHHSRSLVRNLKHMTIAHSFFIPDPEYCINIKGLILYLGEKIHAGFMCIWCNHSGRTFQSAEAVKAHMIDKGHCKVLHEGEALVEYAEFYDYSSSYPDAGTEDPDAEVVIPELDDSDYQLVLPSGNIIGHRSLMRYYKQSLNPNRAVAISKSEKLRKVLSQYRALGWTETQKEAVAKKARDIKYMQRVQTKYSTQLQFKANKLQRYFRPQVNF